MNKERLMELATVIEESKTFCQDYYYNHSGCPSCIAGHAVDHFRGITDTEEGPSLKARRILSLDSRQAIRLFLDWPDNEKITRELAAGVIRHLAKSGEVAWDLFCSNNGAYYDN